MRPAIFIVVTLGLAVLHFGLLVVMSIIAGLTPNARGAHALMQILSFPVSLVPQAQQNEFGLLLWIGNSVVWGGLVGAILNLTWRHWGHKGPLLTIALMLVAALAVLIAPALRPVDWTPTAQKHWEEFEFRLPRSFAVSAEENAHREAIHRNLFPDRPLPALQHQRWYVGYRPTTSGAPEFDAVVVAQSHRTAPNHDAFIATMNAQRDARWSAVQWQFVESGDRWRLERGVLPTGGGEESRLRLLRLVSTSPLPPNHEHGLWLGLVAREDRFEAQLMKQTFVGILDSVMHHPPAPLRQTTEGSDSNHPSRSTHDTPKR